ncbi:MAG: hypothetical protein Q9180_003264 [Flavoplaca navasiana]
MSSPPSTQPEKVWYDANCHCRLVRLRLRIAPLYTPLPEPPSSSSPSSHTSTPLPSTHSPNQLSTPFACNCSICTKNGYLNIYPSSYENDIEWLHGKDEMTAYEYGPCERKHMFCKRCGSSVALFSYFGGSKEGKSPMVGINVCDCFFPPFPSPSPFFS